MSLIHGASGAGPAAALAVTDPGLHVLGKVTFHLAENRRDLVRPFAFLAAYAHQLSAAAAVEHLPLGEAWLLLPCARPRVALGIS